MKHFGKRVLATILTFGITSSVLVTDMSAMQVYAAGNSEYVEESASVEPEVDISEEISVEETESFISEQETEERVELNSLEEVQAKEENVTVEVSEETVTEEMSTEMTETVTEEPDEGTTYIHEADAGMESIEPNEQLMATSSVNKGFTLSADENGRLVVEFEKGTNEVSGNVEIPKEVKIIPSGIFTNKIFVDTVTFEEASELVTIEKEAFFGSSIASILLPKSLQVIEEKAFYSADLKRLVFEAGGEQVTIGELAFAKNYNLEEITTNGRIKALGDSAFLDDRKIDETVELSGVAAIGAKAFYGCESLDYVVIPDTVKVIEESAFENCKALGKHDMAFYRGVNAVQFGNGVTEIKDAAFKGCNGLQELILPQNVEELGHDVFGGCTSLKNIKIYNMSGADSTSACNIKLTYTSFPNLKGLTLEAYDGTVEDWAGNHTAYGVVFKSLYQSYAIKIGSLKNGSITTNKLKAKMGDTVTVEVTPAEGYVLEYGSLYYTYMDDTNFPKRELIDTGDYAFEMPGYDVTIYATFVKSSKSQFGDYLILEKIDDKTNDDISYNEEEKVLTFSKPWQSAKIRVKGSNDKIPLCDQLSFTSSNTKAVTIDAKGNIRVVAPTNNTKITVALVDKESTTQALTFTVKVGPVTYVNDMTLDYTAAKAKIDYTSDGNGEAAEIGYDIITYPASLLKVASRTIKIVPVGRDNAGDKLDISWQISSNDSAIAKPKTSSFVGNGTIIVPKGALGETVVTLKAKDGSDEPVTKQFIIRIIDDIPRLANSNITVDPQSVTGALLDLVSVYDASLNVDDLSIRKKVVKKGNTVYQDADDVFELVETEGKVYLRALEEETAVKYDVGKKYTYKNTYYIHGTMAESNAEFYIEIPTLTICKKKISPTVKLSGKINLFYNGKASLDKSGVVTVTQNQKDLTVEDCYLVGNAKTNGVNFDDDNAFTENFSVEFNKEKQSINIIRTRDDDELSCYTQGKSKNKPVLNGKLRIKYEGYMQPFDIKITVPTKTTVPSYTLSLTKISLNSYAKGQEYEVSFINKKTKKIEDLIESETVIALDRSDSGTTDGLIEENAPEFGFDSEKDTVHLKMVQSKKGKIVLILRQPEWEDQSGWNKKATIKAAINVSASNKFPTAKLGKTTLTLNAACPDALDYTTMVLNQTDSTLLEEQLFVPTGRTKSDNLSVWYDSEKGRVVAEIEDGATVKKGTYSFACTPKFSFNTTEGNAMTRSASKVTVKVKVNDTTPSINLKKNSFTINANCLHKDEMDKYDYVTTGYSWSNLPVEYSDYTLSDADKVISFTGKGTDYIGEEWIQFEVDETTRTVKIYVNAPEKVVGSSSYKVDGLKLVKDGVEIPIKAISFKLKCVDKTPGVSVKAKGTINPLDSSTKIEYTPKLSNINGTVIGVELREVAENGSLLPVEEANFVAEHDAKTGKTIVKVKEPEVNPDTGEIVSRVQLENRTYRIQLYYVLSNGNGESKRVPGTYQVTKDQKITPKQTMPKISVDTKKATFFAGDKSRTQKIVVAKKSTNAEISNIKFSNKTPLTLRNAFVIERYDKESGEMVLRLKNSAFIKQNTEQTLTFEIECEGQLKNTVGTTFTVKVKVIK